jgi:hypothetical protein
MRGASRQMINKNQITRLASLIGKFNGERDAAKFRNEWRELSQDATAAERAALTTTRELVERWTKSQGETQLNPLQEWVNYYRSASGILPARLIIACLDKMPISQSSAEQWRAILTSCTDIEVVRSGLRHKRFTRKQLGQWFCAAPEDFINSALLDFVIEAKLVKPWQKVWKTLKQIENRPAKLASKQMLIVSCYASWLGRDAEAEFQSFLVESSADRKTLLPLILQEPTTAFRFLRALAEAISTSPSRNDLLIELAREAIQYCAERTAARLDSDVDCICSTAICVFRLHLAELRASRDAPTVADLESSLSEAETVTSLKALQRIEENTTSPSSSRFFVLRGSELHDVSLGHVRAATQTADSGGQDRRRETTYETYLGKKDVLEQIIFAIDQLDLQGEIRDAFDVVLFNCGVRPIGAVEEKMAFQPRVHEATQPGILPGEQVRVVRPGARLGDREQAIVLMKARVAVIP